MASQQETKSYEPVRCGVYFCVYAKFLFVVNAKGRDVDDVMLT